jgi:hypothetical protein
MVYNTVIKIQDASETQVSQGYCLSKAQKNSDAAGSNTISFRTQLKTSDSGKIRLGGACRIPSKR